MDEIDLQMAMETYLIKHNEDLYNAIIESPERSPEESMNINYEYEYEDVTQLLRDLFSDTNNADELANILGLELVQEE